MIRYLALVLVAAATAASAQPPARRATNIEALLAHPAFYHQRQLIIVGRVATQGNGELRVAATGAGPTAVRLASVEQSGDPEDAVKDVEPQDDPLASAWYRKRILPRLVARALEGLG